MLIFFYRNKLINRYKDVDFFLNSINYLKLNICIIMIVIVLNSMK